MTCIFEAEGRRWLVPEDLFAPRLAKALSDLSPLTAAEQAALDTLTFQLGGPHSPEVIAAHIRITARSVRRIEKRALEKMRHFVSDADWSTGIHSAPTLQTGMGQPFATNGANTTPWSDGGQHDGSRS